LALLENAETAVVGKPITINRIFSDNRNWDVYKLNHCSEVRRVEVVEVEKMLVCQRDGNGYCTYYCPHCKETVVVHFGCNSRVCTHCGKRFADKWAGSVAKGLFDVVHRHCVFTIPDVLWPLFRERRGLLKELMDCCIRAIAKMIKKKFGKSVKPGIVAVLHTFGKDLKFYPHLHCLVAEGGVKSNGEWVDVTYFPFDLLRKYWQYEVLKMLKRKLPKTKENKQFLSSLFSKHKDGFYVRAQDRVKSKREIIKYIGRYIRHPAIAESRIDSYDGKRVVFHYFDHENVKHSVNMSIDEFISAVIGHIPDRHFKVIRYYGLYARQDRKKYRYIVGEDSSYGTITQASILKFMGKHIKKCMKCGNIMEFIEYVKRKPPDSEKFGDKITDWAYIR